MEKIVKKTNKETMELLCSIRVDLPEHIRQARDSLIAISQILANAGDYLEEDIGVNAFVDYIRHK